MSYSQKMEQGYLSLVAGLDTESSPLNAREGTTSDELNMVLDTDGMIRRRRKGILERDSQEFTVEINDPRVYRIVGQYYWDDATNLVTVTSRFLINEVEDEEDPEETVYVRTVEYTVIFSDPDDLSEAVVFYSFDIPGESFDNLEDAEEDPEPPLVYPQFTELRDSLIVLFGGRPMVFRQNTDGLDVYNLNLSVRDFKLIDDDLSIPQRPSTLSDAHRYNLRNAGWIGQGKDKEDNTIEFLSFFEEVLGEYPSNSDIVSLGIREDFSSDDRDKYFDPEEFERLPVYNSEAPRGKFIYPIFRINRGNRLSAFADDGSRGPFVNTLLENGLDPDTGTEPNPGDPIFDPRPPCLPGEVCTIEP